MLGHGSLGELALGQLPGIAEPVDIDAEDVLLVSVADALATPAVLLALSEVLAVTLQETIAGNGAVLASDTLAIAISDSIGILATQSVYDAIGVDLDEALDLTVEVGPADAISINLLEADSAIAALTSTSDTIGIRLIETLEVLTSVACDEDLLVAAADFLSPRIWQKPKSAAGKVGVGAVSGRVRCRSTADVN